jgi:hypothetical protein
LREKKNNKKIQSSKIVERGERGGWIAITNNKKVQSFERIKKEKGGGLPLLVAKKFRTLSFEKVERIKKGHQSQLPTLTKLQISEL